MLHVYGVDILDLGTDRLSWPRLARLITHLPRESHTMREVAGEAARWGELEHLVALLIDTQAQSNWMYASVHSKQRPEMPPPLRRPGTSDPRRIGGKRSYTSAEIDEIRARMTPMAGVNDAGS